MASALHRSRGVMDVGIVWDSQDVERRSGGLEHRHRHSILSTTTLISKRRSPVSSDSATSLNLPRIIVPKRHVDGRGWFSEIFHEQRLHGIGITCRFVQDNLSSSKRVARCAVCTSNCLRRPRLSSSLFLRGEFSMSPWMYGAARRRLANMFLQKSHLYW